MTICLAFKKSVHEADIIKLHFRCPELHVEVSFFSNITKHLGEPSPFEHLHETLNLNCTVISLLHEKHRLVQIKHLELTLFHFSRFSFPSPLLVPNYYREPKQCKQLEKYHVFSFLMLIPF